MHNESDLLRHLMVVMVTPPQGSIKSETNRLSLMGSNWRSKLGSVWGLGVDFDVENAVENKQKYKLNGTLRRVEGTFGHALNKLALLSQVRI